MNKKMSPHIIAAGAFVVFIALGLACASTPSAPIGTLLSDGSSVDYSWYSDGSAEEFIISTAAQLAGFADIANKAKDSPAQSDFSGKTITLANDLDLSVIEMWKPISLFMGTFDGNGKTISNITNINKKNIFSQSVSGSQGLFGTVGESGVVKNLALTIVNFSGNQHSNVGGVAGINRGVIQNCFVSGNIDGYCEVGGVAGRNYGTVQNCYTTVNITGKDTHKTEINDVEKTDTEIPEFSENIGGLVGVNMGTVRKCVALNESITRNAYKYLEDYSPVELATMQKTQSTLGRIPGSTSLSHKQVIPKKPQGQPSLSFGRVAGASQQPIADCYGLQGMSFTSKPGGAEDKATGIPAGNLTGIQGNDVNAGQIANESWWANTIGWDFDNVWQWDNAVNLPRLR